MTETILDNMYMILLLPLWIFLLIMLGRFFSVYINQRIIHCISLLSSLLGLFACSYTLLNYGGEIFERQINFITTGNFVLNYGLYIDKQALIFGVVLFFISFCVQLFSISYMRNEKKKYRFWGLLNIFIFAMSGLIFSPNLFQLYVFWEIVGIISYLLIGFEYHDNIKSLASKKVFIINRIGDTFLLCGVILISYFMYNYVNNIQLISLPFLDFTNISTFLYAYSPKIIYLSICFSIITAAFVKSAQFPFYTWLQDAMQAKLPVSALLHSATMVAMGVFLLLRFMPFLILDNHLLQFIQIVGILTAIICSLCACHGDNAKKILAYSTSAQLGLVFFALGNLNIKAAIVLFIAHSVIKSLLFITLPQQDEKWSYFNFILFICSALSICGILFSGVIAKNLVYMSCTGDFIKSLYLLIVFLTTFYILKIALVIAKKQGLTGNITDKLNILPFAVLFMFNIMFYYYLKSKMVYSAHEVFLTSIAAVFTVLVLYKYNKFFRIPILYQLMSNGFYLDYFYTKILANLYNKFCSCCNNIDLRCLMNTVPIVFIIQKWIQLIAFMENDVVNQIVRFIAVFTRKISFTESRLQTGNVQKYNKYALTIILIIIIITLINMLNYTWGNS